MQRRTHRSRLLVLFLLLLSPGLGGWAVQVVHPCSAGASQAAAHGGNDHNPHPAPASGGQAAECHCFGTCYPGPTFQRATAPTFAAPIPTFALTLPRAAEPERPVARRRTPLQPPATPPPVLS